MGAVYCRLNQLDEAYNAFDQGLKQQRQNWKMWENFMFLSLRTRRYGRALYGQEQLYNDTSSYIYIYIITYKFFIII